MHKKIKQIVAIILMMILCAVASPITLFIALKESMIGLVDKAINTVFSPIEWIFNHRLVTGEQEEVEADIKKKFEEKVPQAVADMAKELISNGTGQGSPVQGDLSGGTTESSSFQVLTAEEFKAITAKGGSVPSYSADYVVIAGNVNLYVDVEPDDSQKAVTAYLTYANAITSTIHDFYDYSEPEQTVDSETGQPKFKDAEEVVNNTWLTYNDKKVYYIDNQCGELKTKANSEEMHDSNYRTCMVLSYQSIDYSEIQKRIKFKGKNDYSQARNVNGNGKVGQGYVIKEGNAEYSYTDNSETSDTSLKAAANAIGGELKDRYDSGMILQRDFSVTDTLEDLHKSTEVIMPDPLKSALPEDSKDNATNGDKYRHTIHVKYLYYEYSTSIIAIDNIKVKIVPEVYKYKEDEINRIIKFLDETKYSDEVKEDAKKIKENQRIERDKRNNNNLSASLEKAEYQPNAFSFYNEMFLPVNADDTKTETESTYKEAERISTDATPIDGSTEVYLKILEKLQYYCDQAGVPLSDLLEDGLAEELTTKGGITLSFSHGNYSFNGTIKDVEDLRRLQSDKELINWFYYRMDNGFYNPYGLQCTVASAVRFYDVYGFDNGGGNGVDVAKNTVAQHSDMFQLSDLPAPGSIASTSGGLYPQYGHTWFVDSVKLVKDTNGNIINEKSTIEFTETNFAGMPSARHVQMTYAEYLEDRRKLLGSMPIEYCVPKNPPADLMETKTSQ